MNGIYSQILLLIFYFFTFLGNSLCCINLKLCLGNIYYKFAVINTSVDGYNVPMNIPKTC